MSCGSGADAFIEKHFKDCVYNVRDYIGFCLGLAAIAFWVVAQLPQYYRNYKTKSAEALSPWFLAQWLLGDTFNLIGALLQGQQLPTTVYTAIIGEYEDPRLANVRDLDDAEAVNKIAELDNMWLPSPAQNRMMTDLCAELHLNKASVIAGLDCHDSYSAKLTELSAQKQQQRAAQGDKITDKQVKFLRQLAVPRTEYEGLTKNEASALITAKVDEKKMAPPTAPQLKMLKDMQYKGSTPATKSKATEIISTIRKTKRVMYLREKARRRGTDPAVVERLVALVMKYDL